MTIKKYNVIEVKGTGASEDYSLYFPHVRTGYANPLKKPCDTFLVNNSIISDAILVFVRTTEKDYPLMYVDSSDVRSYSYNGILIDPNPDASSITIKISEKTNFCIFQIVNIGKVYDSLVGFKSKPLEITPIYEE